MARSRVYRHDIRGPECGSNWMRKNGFTNGRQAYRRRTRPRRALRPQRLLLPQLVQRGAPPFLTQPSTAAGV